MIAAQNNQLTNGNPAWHRVCLYLVLVMLATSSVYTALRSLGWPMAHDSPIMHYISWRILEGSAPYKDVFDMNMPGTYLLHMMVIKFLGPGHTAWHVFSAVWASLTSLLIAVYCAPYGRRSAALASLLFLCYYFGNNLNHIGQRDFLLCPFLMFGAYSWARYLESGQRLHHLFLAGLSVGAGATVKPIAVVLLAFIACSHLWKTRREPKRLFGGSIALIAGALIAPSAVLLWLSSTGSVGPFWQLLTDYLPLYARLPGETRAPIPLSLASRFLVLVPLLPFAPMLARSRAADDLRRYTVLIGCGVYGALHFLLQQKGWYYHLYPINLFFLTLAGMALGDALRAPSRRTRTLATAAVLVVSLPFVGRCLWQGATPRSLEESRPRVASLVEDISTFSLSEGDKVQVLDATRGGIHALYLLKIRQPTRFVYDIHFYHDLEEPLIKSLRREFIEDLRRDLPKLVVLFDHTWVLPRGVTKLASFPELATLLEENYRIGESHYGYTVYVASHPSPSAEE